MENLKKKVAEEAEEFIHWSLPDPWPLAQIAPQMHVFNNGKDMRLIGWDQSSEETVEELIEDKLLSSNKIFVITHGFENSIETPWLPEMKDAILATVTDCTVILVGWGNGASIGVLHYSQASANTLTCGAWVAEYLTFFRKKLSSSSLKIHGIGHSLGSHLLGIAGRTSKAFDRISGLDPAGPCFEKVNQENRLCKTDAKVVDVIHTDGYSSYFDPADWFAPVNHYGTLLPLGTIDFYPNGGHDQPGIGHFTIAGSHHRSIELYIWSIKNPGKFKTNTVLDGKPEFEKPVDKYKSSKQSAEMGFHFSMKETGLYYIETQSQEPWVTPKLYDYFCCVV